MNQFFNADLLTLRSFFNNEYNPNDRGKNYYIPLYQREYKWNRNNILKLFEDIYNVSLDNNFESYFLGGVVLSRSSMEGDERTNKSLEVIDGQQRLTTLSILIAIIIQCLKHEKRDFVGKQDYVYDLIEQLTGYVISKRYDDDYQAIWVLKVERSDNLQEYYFEIIKNLIDKKFIYTEFKNLEGENKDFFLKVKALHQKVKRLRNDELLHFTIQLLDHTQIVTTKTDSFETGYLVFEKLNDNGVGLLAHELLKNYLFSIKKDKKSNLSNTELVELNKVETEKLKYTWEELINKIDKIEPKLTPKTFLEYYLIIIGKNYKNSSTSEIFKEHRLYFEDNIDCRLDILEKMCSVADKLGSLRKSIYAEKTLNKLNFKLGFLILLSFYEKYTDQYEKYENKLFNLIFRFGFVHLIIEKIKPMNKLIKKLCITISESENVENCFSKIEKDINELILDEKHKFIESLSEVDRFNNRDHFVKIFFEILNLEVGLGYIDDEILQIERIVPNLYEDANYDFEDINEDNISKYSNLLGNLVIYNSEDDLDIDFRKRFLKLSSLDNIFINHILNNDSIITENKFFELKDFNNVTKWNKTIIENRTRVLTNIAVDLFINDKISIDLSFKED